MEACMSVVVDGKTLLTYEDYVHFPDDGRRHEIIGGVHYVSPSPNRKHQKASRMIQHQLIDQIELKGLGEVIDAPMDVILSQIDVVQPDLLVVLKTNPAYANPKNVRGAPDLVVEIVSPSTASRDLELKKALYQARGVPEYWIVRPKERDVERFVLEAGAYRSAGRFADHVEFGGAPGVAVDLGSVW
jgi:Uma2 family endonuclease